MSKRKEFTAISARIKPEFKLRRYMWEKLQLEKKKAKSKDAGGEGESLTTDESKRYNSLRTDKKRVLENIVFPSMANLIFFFECIYEEPILKKTFEDDNDIQELLGIIRRTPNPDNYGIYFTRLLQAILNFKEYNEKDFRLRLMHEAHKIITSELIHKVCPPMYEKIRGISYLLKNIDQDMARALGCTEMISKDVKEPYQFSILQLHEGTEPEIQRQNFAQHTRIESPNRSLDVNTKVILKLGH